MNLFKKGDDWMLVPLKELKVGMKLAQDVFCSKTNRRLLSKGHKLTGLSIAIIVGRGDYEHLDIVEEEKKQEVIINLKEIVEDIPELVMSPAQKSMYQNLYKAVESFVQAENKYNWDLCRINIKKFLNLNLDRIGDFLYLIHCTPVMNILTARIVNSMIQAAILLKQVQSGFEDIYRVCEATLFAYIGLKKFGDTDAQHIEYGINLIKSLDPGAPEDVLEAVAQHHERLDGSGFPKAIEEVHLWAQVLGICDDFNQFIYQSIQEENFEDRPYWSKKFEPEIIQLFSKSITDISTRCFTTEDGKIGKIIFARNIEKPIVMIESEKDFRGWKFSILEKRK